MRGVLRVITVVLLGVLVMPAEIAHGKVTKAAGDGAKHEAVPTAAAEPASFTVTYSLMNQVRHEPQLQDDWLAWEKRLHGLIEERFRFFSKKAFDNAPDLTSVLSFKVTNDNHIVNIVVDTKSPNNLFNVLAYQAVKSLDGDASIRFPSGTEAVVVGEQCYFNTRELAFGIPPKTNDLAEYLRKHPGITQLYLREYCGTVPKQLPEGLKAFIADRWTVTEMPELPNSLERLSVMGCAHLKALPKLPKSLKVLSVVDCNSLGELPVLPESIIDLTVSNCESIRGLPKLPSSLAVLRIDNCASFAAVPQLPSSIRDLEITDCRALKAVPLFPTRLESIHIRGCTAAPNSTVEKIPPQAWGSCIKFLKKEPPSDEVMPQQTPPDVVEIDMTNIPSRGKPGDDR